MTNKRSVKTHQELVLLALSVFPHAVVEEVDRELVIHTNFVRVETDNDDYNNTLYFDDGEAGAV